MKIKYPKFLLFFVTLFVAYLMLAGRRTFLLSDEFLSLGYGGTFFSGIFYSFGLTAAPATAVIILLSSRQNLLLTSVIAGAGALLGDLAIFKFIRHFFDDEIDRLSEERAVRFFDSFLPLWFKRFYLPALAFFVIASPLPDELGVALLASLKGLSSRAFSFLSYALNTLGIYVILSLAQTLVY